METPAGAEPLLACYRRRAAPQIRAAIEAGRLRAGDLGQVLTLRTIGLAELATFGEPSRLLTNINSPKDLSTIVSS